MIKKIASLKNESKSLFPALTLSGNPMIVDIENLSSYQIRKVIEQYSMFSNEAIHMLLDAMIRSYQWPILFSEIQENIEEEKGKFTEGVPHLEMMRMGYAGELGIDTTSVESFQSTESFLMQMKKIFRSNDLPFLCGALIAFEGVAIEEFAILEEIVKDYCSKSSIPPESLKLTRSYIEGHREFEIGHESHLIESASSYINDTNFDQVREGYMKVCFTIANWWISLYQNITDK
jgi:hypothetical protein